MVSATTDKQNALICYLFKVSSQIIKQALILWTLIKQMNIFK